MARVYPIGFSIHASKIVNEVPEKTQLLASLIPGNTATYIYHNEQEYYDAYKTSYFAITQCKAGWDCMRHYEILACGCIPLFTDIEHCPPNTMTLFPKDIILQTNQIYHDVLKHSTDPITEAERMNIKEQYIEPLLHITRQHLTNTAIAQYILTKSDHRTVNKILFLSGDTHPDYLRCVTLPGFKERFGTECHDYPKIPHIYTDYPAELTAQLYGRGLSYTRIVEPSLHNDVYDTTVIEDIHNHTYDLIIYGNYHRGTPFWEEVTSAYNPRDVVLMCGEDIHSCNHHDLATQGFILFVREL